MFDSTDFVELPEDELFRIDRICDEFELRLIKGLDASIENLLVREKCPKARIRLLRNLIVVEVEKSGQDFSHSQFNEYLRRFPDDAGSIEDLFQRNDLTHIQDQKDRTLKSSTRGVLELDLKTGQEIGKYKIDKCIGTGSFGVVYKAWDTELERHVALKVAKRDGNRTDDNYSRSVSEARSSASIKANGIATIYDFVADEELVYIVQEYVEGQNLSQLIAIRKLTAEECAGMVARIARAMALAHDRNICHRDLKPSNVIVDADGMPTVVDFGLAIQGKATSGRRKGVFGTPCYMSPEQVRGEIGRTDPSSDVWAIGVILYELLAGCRPFEADDDDQLFLKIQTEEPARLDQDQVDAELNRIVFRCLAKKKRYRYSNAGVLADDLQRYLDSIGQRESDDKDSVSVSPKGLRAFTSEDSSFFLDLVPGYKNYQGIPESIAFWKNWVEQGEKDEKSSVGLIHGFSGCGKSSFVNAGLLPLLSDNVVALPIEATPDETEIRLFHALRKQFPSLSEGSSLPDAFVQVRDGGLLNDGEKLLIVIDQFEQWLSKNSDQERLQLANALRHCDGKNLQVILLVRQEFWPDADHFLDEFEIPLLLNENCVRLELFDIEHAERVLEKFGQAYGRLGNELTNDQKVFIKQVIEGLSESDRVIAIRVVLFAEAFRDKDWTVDSLAKHGGAKGVGVVFLNDKFLADDAPLECKTHAVAAQDFLLAMLPDETSELKGNMQSKSELMKITGYNKSGKKFDRLLEMLDGELRLVTRTSPSQVAIDEEGNSNEDEYYQLSHDYLVPVLRNWIGSEKQRFLSGRLNNRMAEISAIWQEVPDSRYLPSWSENLKFRLFTKSNSWTPIQREMMEASRRHHFARSVVGSLLMLVCVCAAMLGVRNWSANRKIEQIKVCRLQDVQNHVERFYFGKNYLIPKLRKQLVSLQSKDPTDESELAQLEREKLNIALALMELGEPNNWKNVVQGLQTVPVDQIELVASTLEPYQQQILPELKSYFEQHPEDRAEVRERRALLMGYLGDSDALISVLLDAEPGRVRKLCSLLLKDRSNAMIRLNRELASLRTKVFAFPSVELEKSIKDAGGVVHRLGAIVFTLPIEQSRKLLTDCFAEGYVPVSYRPYFSDTGAELVAIAWNRNTEFLEGNMQDCVEIKTNLTLTQLDQEQLIKSEQGWRLVDISCIEWWQAKNPNAVYSCVWCRNDLGLETRFDSNLTLSDLERVIRINSKAGFQVSRMLSNEGVDGEPRFAVLWDNECGIAVTPDVCWPGLKFLYEAETEQLGYADCQIADVALESICTFKIHCEVMNVEPVYDIYSNNDIPIRNHQHASRLAYYVLLMPMLGHDDIAVDLAKRLSRDLPYWKDEFLSGANLYSRRGNEGLLNDEIKRIEKLSSKRSDEKLTLPLLRLRFAVGKKNEKLANKIFDEIHQAAGEFEDEFRGDRPKIGTVYSARIRANLLLAKLFDKKSERRIDLVDEAMNWLVWLDRPVYEFLLVDSDFDMVRKDERFQEFVRTKGMGIRTTKSWRLGTSRSQISSANSESDVRNKSLELFSDAFVPRSLSCRFNLGSPVFRSVWEEFDAADDTQADLEKLANVAYLLLKLDSPDCFEGIENGRFGSEMQDLILGYRENTNTD